MKTILRAFIFFSFTATAQEIPKKANTIVVKGVSFNEVVNQLLDKGYFIDKADTTLNLITTKETTCKLNKGVFVTYMIRIKDSSVIIKGTCTDHIGYNISGVIVEAQNYEIVYKGGLFKRAFEDMNNLALSFNKPVEYLIK